MVSGGIADTTDLSTLSASERSWAGTEFMSGSPGVNVERSADDWRLLPSFLRAENRRAPEDWDACGTSRTPGRTAHSGPGRHHASGFVCEALAHYYNQTAMTCSVSK